MIKKNRVIVIDDEFDIREALQDWLSRDYEIISFDSADSFLDALKKHDFNDGVASCILLDFKMPKMTGVELQRKLNELKKKFSIIFMSGNAMHSDIIDAWQGGAADFILKPFTATQISEKLNKMFTKGYKTVRLLSSRDLGQGAVDIPISSREAQVLILLGQGYQQVEVAHNLGISLRTVKMHRTAIKNKLNLHTLMDLARYYDEHYGLISQIAEKE